MFRRTKIDVVLSAGLLALLAGCGKSDNNPTTCFENSDGVVICSYPDGTCRDREGNTVCCTADCSGSTDLPATPDTPDDDGTDTAVDPELLCHCTASTDDSDGDCVQNNVDPNASVWDTDSDGIGDGCEDRNHNGVVDRGEMDPRNPDSDSDGLPDGMEDVNHNGRRDAGETSAISGDTDSDGVADGSEDTNRNGVVDPWVDTSGNGCWDLGLDQPGESDPRRNDSDGDGIADRIEDKNHNGACDAGETCLYVADTDCDGIIDGNEDVNRDGIFGRGETNPLARDTDGDGIDDGVEDANRDGVYDAINETNPLLPDSDFDGIADGTEDRNHDGRVDGPGQYDANGCFDASYAETSQGESNPRKYDSDDDGIPDGLEDSDHDGYCYTASRPSRINPSTLVPSFIETCAWLADTDCDGLDDGQEDVDLSGGATDPGELDPRDRDTDLDGLFDGCMAWMSGLCEDSNNDGFVDAAQDVNGNGRHDVGEPGESNPLDYDSDADGLSDGCERGFVGGASDPINADTDGDGVIDGVEDADHNCQTDSGETDPRVADPPPADGTKEKAEWEVCGAQNLKQLTFARSVQLDYQLAFEVERNEDTFAESRYVVSAFGQDNNDNGFNPNELADLQWGHVFQSDSGVVFDAATGVIQRQVYGFIVATEDTRQLDDVLDSVRSALATAYPDVSGQRGLEQVSALTERPAHDNLENFPVSRAQRQYRVLLPAAKSALMVRNEILLNTFLQGATPDPVGVPPVVDAVYGATPPTTVHFSLYISAVSRPAQLGPTGLPLVLTIVALTPDDSTSVDDDAVRLFAERQSRLEDITGGSALARTTNGIASTCEKKNVKRAVADLLWVVDDSASMQTLIKRLQTAAHDARMVFSANTPIVDFRLAMTTTNPSRVARSQCYQTGPGTTCSAACTGAADCTTKCADSDVGCLYVCPSGCALTNCDPNTGICTCSSSPCIIQSAIALGIANDFGAYPLPGGGGTFYYEDGELLDCDSSSNNQIEFTNRCDATAYDGLYDAFMTAGAIGGNAGFIRAVADVTCASSLLNLTENAANAVSCNGETDPACCPRLTSACSDGTQVLESQMCDLVRAMGGLPDANNSTTRRTGRAHASPENGSRSARRLLQSMLPALPANYSGPTYVAKDHLRLTCCSYCNPATDTTCAATCCSACDPATCPASNPDCCSHPGVDGGLNCSISAQCQPCTPGVDAYCPAVPLVTLFLSDEEDFWFKDECSVDATSFTVKPDGVDTHPLPTLCRYADGNAATTEECTQAYCDGQNFLDDPPLRYNPELAAWTNDSNARFNSLRQRPSCMSATTQGPCEAIAGCDWDTTNVRCFEIGDLSCSPYVADSATSCIGDPCAALRTSAACSAYNTYYNAAVFSSVRGSMPDVAMCRWDAAGAYCRNACTDYTKDTGATVWPSEQATIRASCEADSRCEWNGSLVDAAGGVKQACVLKLETNDCRPCKRLKRLRQALEGEQGDSDRCSGLTQGDCAAAFMCAWSNSSCQSKVLTGLDAVGPVYAIVRDVGQSGTGGFLAGQTSSTPVTVDKCGGGTNTWGRGDGSAYRDLAIATHGRTQDVCADSYKDFMQVVVTDIVSLSAPYPLLGSPIAATIKVGRARPLSDGSYQYEEVPRSLSCGFNYNPTTNSIGFKRNAPNAECTPEEKDLVIISYRYWLPVPCRGLCQDYETCAQSLCVAGMQQPVCDTAADCPDENDECISGLCSCTANDVVDRCVPQACGECKRFEGDQCVDITAAPGECRCVPSGTSGLPCTPGGPNVCPIGQRCSEDSCTCISANACPGVDFDANGNFTPEANCTVISTCASCQAALDCCTDWAAIDATCSGLTQGGCSGNTSCTWLDIAGRCAPATAPSPCCNVGETPSCFLDPETGRASVVCQPPQCVCQGLTCDVTCASASAGVSEAACEANTNCVWENNRCNATVCESFQTCETTDAGTNECVPACVPVQESCEDLGGTCECLFNPP